MPPVFRSALLASLPPESTLGPRPAAASIVVLDDDPTGTQTVHAIPVLTRWDVTELTAALREPGSCFYLLTNTRAFPRARACAINREIGVNLAIAAARAQCNFTVVSRSDSTLRGHFPAETDALAAGLGRAFDGTLLIPAFFAGGRLTIGDTHYVAEGDVATPALWPPNPAEFARLETILDDLTRRRFLVYPFAVFLAGTRIFRAAPRTRRFTSATFTPGLAPSGICSSTPPARSRSCAGNPFCRGRKSTASVPKSSGGTCSRSPSASTTAPATTSSATSRG